MKLECYIAKDLLPSYIDHLTCNDTNKRIEEHLSECEDCQKVYDEMKKNIPIQTIDPILMNNNKKQVSYLNKSFKWIIILASIVALLVTVIVVYVIAINFSVSILTEKEQSIYNEVSDYEQIYGSNGEYKKELIGYNDIFPNQIPDSAEVETFYFEHFTQWDDSYLGYLVYTCDSDDYELEYQRLKAIQSSEKTLVYSATGFPYELCAVYADEIYGYIYALADEENNRFIYVDNQFCNYFADIDYEKIIPKKYLPYGFDAKEGNAARIDFEKNTWNNK